MNSTIQLTPVRYVMAPGNLAYVSVIGTSIKVVVNTSFLRKLLGLHPRTVLGNTSVNADQLSALLGPIPQKGVVIDDSRIAVGS